MLYSIFFLFFANLGILGVILHFHKTFCKIPSPCGCEIETTMNIRKLVFSFRKALESLVEPVGFWKEYLNAFENAIPENFSHVNEEILFENIFGPCNIYVKPFEDWEIVSVCIGNSLRELKSYPITSLRYKYVFSDLVNTWMKKCPTINDETIRAHMEHISHPTLPRDYVISRKRIDQDLINFSFMQDDNVDSSISSGDEDDIILEDVIEEMKNEGHFDCQIIKTRSLPNIENSDSSNTISTTDLLLFKHLANPDKSKIPDDVVSLLKLHSIPPKVENSEEVEVESEESEVETDKEEVSASGEQSDKEEVSASGEQSDTEEVSASGEQSDHEELEGEKSDKVEGEDDWEKIMGSNVITLSSPERSESCTTSENSPPSSYPPTTLFSRYFCQ